MGVKVKDLNESEYLELVYAHLAYEDVEQMYTLDYYEDIVDEMYDKEADDWYLAKRISVLLYDAKRGVIVSVYLDTDLQDGCVLSCEKAQEWFKSGWKGLVNKTLTKEEFVSYCDLCNNCDLCNKKYIQRKGVKELINDFLKFAPEFGEIIKF